ncbi:GNAT family N-acetyltransferase [Coleofasciculus sp. E2-BRE-01]|uniref:GNAT family N-acetyltransferase n=1 Tax=Coleofasciculus sp. E2-BRE-01 TaxID=3069524 RepID=UPI0032F67AB5
MTTLTMRSHRGKADLDAIALFLKTCEAVDLPNEYPSVSEILMQFDAPSVNQQRDIRLWEDAEGQLIALAGLMIPTVGETVDGFLWFRVHPTQRVDSLYRNIITWAEARMQEVCQERCLAVSFCDGYIPKDGNQGWINPVGTRRDYRKQGVARSMLQAVMQQLKTEGMETAMLYVDAENPSGARRLYESVGFQTTHTQIAYVKDIAG